MNAKCLDAPLALHAGFTPGTVIWGRVRKIGTGGEVGDWSDPAQIRAS